jgi:hypothetical protein
MIENKGNSLMELEFWHFIFGLLGLILYTASFTFAVFRWYDIKIDSRINSMKESICKRIDRIEQEYVHKDDMSRALQSVETMLESMCKEQQRTNQRMDDLMKWLMDTNSKRT